MKYCQIFENGRAFLEDSQNLEESNGLNIGWANFKVVMEQNGHVWMSILSTN